jgi:hypothetical protein
LMLEKLHLLKWLKEDHSTSKHQYRVGKNEIQNSHLKEVKKRECEFEWSLLEDLLTDRSGRFDYGKVCLAVGTCRDYAETIENENRKGILSYNVMVKEFYDSIS